MTKYRIVQRETNAFYIQQRDCWFWWRNLAGRRTEREARSYLTDHFESQRINRRIPLVAEFDKTGREVRDLC